MEGVHALLVVPGHVGIHAAILLRLVGVDLLVLRQFDVFGLVREDRPATASLRSRPHTTRSGC